MPYQNIDYIPIIVALATAAALAALATWKKLLTIPATVTAAIIFTLAALFTGYVGIVVYGVSFALSALMSLVGKGKRETTERSLHKRYGARKTVQVLCNGAPALVYGAVWFFTGRGSLMIAFVASLAAGLADSAASDIGMLSRTRARNIITMKEVPTGISGGVTILGLIAALAASAVVGAVAIPFAGYGWRGFLATTGLAFVGTIIDSILGATVQVKYRCSVCDALTERTVHCDSPTVKAGGFAHIDNDIVNVISLTVVGLLAALIFMGS